MKNQMLRFAITIQICFYIIYLISLHYSYTRIIHDEYIIQKPVLSFNDCETVKKELKGLMICDLAQQTDGASSQDILYDASVWNDFPADRERLHQYTKHSTASIDKSIDWTRPTLPILFYTLPIVELLIFAFAAFSPLVGRLDGLEADPEWFQNIS